MYILRCKSPGMWRRVVRRAVTDVSKPSIADFVSDLWPRGDRHYQPPSKRRELHVQRRSFIPYKARVFSDTALIACYLRRVSPTSNSFFVLKQLMFSLRHVNSLSGISEDVRLVSPCVQPSLVDAAVTGLNYRTGHQLQSRNGIALTLTRVLQFTTFRTRWSSKRKRVTLYKIQD